MDWAKPKNERAEGDSVSQTPNEKGTKARKMAASVKEPLLSTPLAWLDELGNDNTAAFQRWISRSPIAAKKSIRANQLLVLPDSLMWGGGTVEAELEDGPEVWHRLLKIISSPVVLPGEGTRKERSSKNRDSSQLRVQTAEGIAQWITRALPVHGSDSFVALICVAWLHGLREFGPTLSPKAWVDVLQCVLTQVERAWSEPHPRELFPWLIWACELPIAIAPQISQVRGNDRIVSDTMQRLNGLLENAIEDPSPWLVRGGVNLRALLASVVRTRFLADQLGVPRWSSRQRKGLSRLAEIALTFTAADGSPLLLDATPEIDDSELWTAVASVAAPNEKLLTMLTHVFPDRKWKNHVIATPKGKAKGEIKSRRKRLLREPGELFAKAELASMRRSWDQPGCRLAIDFSREPMWLDCVGTAGQKLLSGEWDLVIRRDGRSLETDIGWSEVCWFSDDDVDYLEVECAVEGACRVQRQAMLIREEGLIFFSDTLLANESAHWTLESSWELAPSIDVRSALKSHEAELIHRKHPKQRQALLLPIGLPEWRRAPSQGKLMGNDGRLLLHQEATGTRLCSPLVLATRKSTRDQPFTWRKLTVAEDLAILGADQAQAFRIQIGKEQTVLYRSLTRPVRRSVMGLHLMSEFYAGRFDADDATFETIVEIANDDE